MRFSDYRKHIQTPTMTIPKNMLLKVVMVATGLALLGSQHAYAFDITHFADSSKLATGHWVKIKVSQTGIHEITVDDVRSWGLSNLSRIHVFGMGGLPLSEKLTEDIPDDLPQLPVVRTEGKLLFYAQGPTYWRDGSAGNMTFLPVQHPYSTNIYYLVTDDERFEDLSITTSGDAPNGTTQTTFTEHLLHEVDLINPANSGRVYLGEDFTGTSQHSFSFDLAQKVAGTDVNVYSIMGVKQATGSAKMTYQYNGTNIASTSSDQIAGKSSEDAYDRIISKKTFNLNSDNALSYSLKLTSTGAPSMARLDYIAVNYTRTLTLHQGQLCFDDIHSSTALQLKVEGTDSASVVWDVTQPWRPVRVNANRTGSTMSFSPLSTGLRRYAVFTPRGTFARPTLVGTVSNQDLHSEPVPDMVIITPNEYREQAQRIATLHHQVDSMRVLVVSDNEVYNEFSGGTPDAMAYRMLCKMFYDRGHQDGHRLGYLLLMGKGTYDNRLITGSIRALNAPMLLTWQTELSHEHSNTYTTDDYFGTLADGSGPRIHQNELDIAVGRMTVKSVTEARHVVDKLVNYVTQPDYGWWKNNAMIVADDGNSGAHLEQAEDMVAAMRANGGSDMIYNRVYLDAFNAVSSGAKRTFPDAVTKHYNTLRNGVVWWTYIGHSGPHAMTDNGLLRHVDLDTKFFYKHVPVLYAATCDFNQFDGSEESGGETLYLNPRGGVIAIICPPRPVRINSNGILTTNIGQYAFSNDEDGLPRRLGDIVRLGKNMSRDENRLRFFLVGDPAMRLALPTHKIRVDSIEGAEEFTSADWPVFHGRQAMTVRGTVTDRNGTPLPNFNGKLTLEMFDYEQSITTHGYSDKSDGSDGKKNTYLDRTNKLAVSIDSIVAGKFTTRIVLPTEVLPRETTDDDSVLYDNFSPSLINMYAYSQNDSIEARGSNEEFIIYGYDDTAEADTIGPVIRFLGLNSENFKNEDQVNESPVVLAEITDDSGINYSTAGIGHTMTLTLDGSTTYSNLIDYYTPRAAAKGTSGTLSYTLNDLTPGHHLLRLRVWDVYNNMSERTVSFNVVKGLKPDIYEVYSTSNPARYETTFYVKHNRPDAVLTIGIEVYDLMGRLVWRTRQNGVSDSYTSFPVTWDLRDLGGRRVPRGIYVYRAILSTDGAQEATKSKKLAVASE